MQLALIGLPASGKTTVFNAITGAGLPTGPLGAGGRPEAHTAVVDVPDSRLEAISARFRPRKTVYAKVAFVDFAGMKLAAGREGISPQLLRQLAQADGFMHVVRAFDDAGTPHPAGSVDPARDLAALHTELLLNDMVVVERRLERLAEERQKGGRDRSTVERETALFRRLADCLAAEVPLRTLDLHPEERRLLAGFGLLTLKPILAVINLAEGQPAPDLGPPPPGAAMLALQGQLESEIAQLSAEDIPAFLAEYGLDEPGSKRVIRAAYDLLGYQTFFTLNEEEAHAWRLRRGGTALEAAATVHTDLARGFIRAEIIAWDELLELGGMAEARARGRLRVEGKDYPVAEGEVVHIRFNV
ncbi:MAG: DUF933 domain-containing protein [Chloroflexota bacterium]